MALAESRTRGAPSAASQPAWLQNVNPAAILVGAVILIMPAIASSFVLTQIFGWAYMLGTIALSLMFLAGYGGMVSLAQMTIAGFAGYVVAILGVNGMPGGMGWPWWLAVPAALILSMIVGAIIGALAVRTEGIYTIMITLAIAAAFFYFTNENYAIFNGHTGINGVPTPVFLGVDWHADDTLLLSRPRRRRPVLARGLLCRARAVRARAAGHSRQPPADGRARLQRQRPSHRGLRVRRSHRGARRHSSGLELWRNRARHGQRLGGDRHPRHRGRWRDRQSDRRLHRRPDLCGAAKPSPSIFWSRSASTATGFGS